MPPAETGERLTRVQVTVGKVDWLKDASSFVEENSYLPATEGDEVVFVKAG